MFGYVMVNEQELKIKDYEKYKSYYCGLCKTLKNCHGKRGQLTLTYDMTFLVLFLTALYEPLTIVKNTRCLLHPFSRHKIRVNEISDYAADMNIVMAYYKCMDDWRDEKSIKGLLGMRLYKRRMKEVARKYKRQCSAVKSSLFELNECEKRKEKNLDVVAGCFGKLTEELFVYKKDEWEGSLRKTGFFLGKFVYLLDAYDDLEKDKEKGNYNPLLYLSDEENYKEKSKQILTMMMAECAREYEKLPIIQEVEILRNIIYSGVWMRYEQVNSRKDKKNGV